MNTLKKYWVWVLSGSLFSASVALVIGAHIGYQAGLHAYDDILVDEALADIYYVSNPVDCPPCNEEKTYEWFYVEPPLDSHPSEELSSLPVKEKGGSDMGP